MLVRAVEEVLRLPEELARVDALLDDPAFFAPFAPFFDPPLGRPSTPGVVGCGMPCMAKLLRAACVRPGTTVIAANVAYPTDSGLLAKAVGTLVRTVRRVREIVGKRRTNSISE
jgi:hypothetical protein